MIRGSTNINWVCEKRVSGRIDAVYDISIPSWTLDTGEMYVCLFCTIMNPPMSVHTYKNEEILKILF